MLEEYFSAPKTLRRLRTGPSAPYIDGFAAMLQENGYSVASAVRYLRAASHLGHFLDSRGMSFAAIDAGISESFRRHLPNCCCPLSNGGTINHHVVFGVKRFHQYLVQLGVGGHGHDLQWLTGLGSQGRCPEVDLVTLRAIGRGQGRRGCKPGGCQ